MSEIVERAANAMLNSAAWSSFWGIEDARIMARAAILAMREPTNAMIEPGALAGELYGNTDAAATWRAMIDVALKEKTRIAPINPKG